MPPTHDLSNQTTTQPAAQGALAQFPAYCYLDNSDEDDPDPSMVTLHQNEVVIETDERTETIPTTAVFDIALDQAIVEMPLTVDNVVSIGYRTTTASSVVIGAERHTTHEFVGRLFQVLVRNVPVRVVHPVFPPNAERSLDRQKATVTVSPPEIEIQCDSHTLEIPLQSIARYDAYQQSDEDPAPATPAVVMIYNANETLTGTLLSLPDQRVLNVFGRLLQWRHALASPP